MMKPTRIALLSLGLVFVAFPGLVLAEHGRDPQRDLPAGAPREQQRLDRETARITDRAADQAARTAQERARILERAAQDPAKAAEDLAKLDADVARDQARIAEDQAKAQDDFAKDAAKAAEDAAERADTSDDGANHGSSEHIRDLGDSEGAEHDEEGFAVRRGELVGIDLSPETVASAEAQGFHVIGRERLESLEREVIRLSVPEAMSAPQGRDLLRSLDPAATVDLVHYYGLNLTAGGRGHRIRSGGGRVAAPEGPAIAVGLIDTSVSHHQALGNARIVTWAAGDLPMAPVDHGTAVASIVAAGGPSTIYSANIFRGTAARPFTSADVIAEALEWQLAQGVQTINMSLAGPRNAILDQLIRDALAHGRIVVAAAGNGGPSAPPAYPAAVPGVVAVTAVDGNLRIYRYANHGRYISVAAQGVDVVAANAPGGYARFSGTSFATPHVAGWLARCRAEGNAGPTCMARLRGAARDLGTPGFDDTFGYGFVG